MACPKLRCSSQRSVWQRHSGVLLLGPLLLLLFSHCPQAFTDRSTGPDTAYSQPWIQGLGGFSNRHLLDSQGPPSDGSCVSSGSTARVVTGSEFFYALLDPSVQLICIPVDLELLEGPALGLWANLTEDIPITRNVTIFGAFGHGEYPVISFGWRDPVRLGVRLLPGVTFLFARLTIKNISRGYVPDIIASGDTTSYVVMYDCIHHSYAGGPPGVVSQIASHSNRPNWAPGTSNVVVFLPKGFCRSGPAPALCWNQSYLVLDMADRLSAATASGTPTPASRLPVKLLMYGVAVVYEQAVEGLCLQKFYSGNLTCMQALSDQLAQQAAQQPNGWVSPPATPAQISDVMSGLVGLPSIPDDVPLVPAWLKVPSMGSGHSSASPSGSPSSSGKTIGIAVGAAAGGILLIVLTGLLWRRHAMSKHLTKQPSQEIGMGTVDSKDAGIGSLGVAPRDSSSSSREADGDQCDSRHHMAVNIGPRGEEEDKDTGTGTTNGGEPGSPVYILHPASDGSRPASGTATGLGDVPMGLTPSSLLLDSASLQTSLESDPSLFRLKEVITGASPVVPSINLQVDMDKEIVLGAKIGTGAMGSVYQGTYRDTQVAVKLFAPGADLTSFAHEISILGRTSHPNVVALLGACFSSNNIALVEELCDGSLEQLMYGSSSQSQHQMRDPSDSNGVSTADMNLLPPGTAAAVAAASTRGSTSKEALQLGLLNRLPEVAKPLHLGTVLSIALEVACGLAYLHPTVIHRDLKPANILLVSKPTPLCSSGNVSSANSSSLSVSATQAVQPQRQTESGPASATNATTTQLPAPFPYLQVKLSDFGLSRMRDAMTIFTQRPYCGTVPYMAPECFNKQWQNGLTHKCDIYSFGIVLWELLHGLRPWYGYAPAEVLYEVAVKNTRPPILVPEDRCPRQLRKLLTRCWDRDPHRRPPALEIIRELVFLQRHLGLQPPRHVPQPQQQQQLSLQQQQQQSRESHQFLSAIEAQINSRLSQPTSAAVTSSARGSNLG